MPARAPEAAPFILPVTAFAALAVAIDTLGERILAAESRIDDQTVLREAIFELTAHLDGMAALREAEVAMQESEGVAKR